MALETTDTHTTAERTATPFIRHSGLLVVLAIAIVTGWLGIDFGGHWDEPRMRRTVQTAVIDGRLLPGWYNYPSVTYDIAGAALLPDIVREWRNADLREVQGAVFDHRDTIRVRTTFLVLTTLVLVWVYMLVYAWRRRWAEALLAAALLGGSWEVAYHARWLAPDGVLMQFAALFTLLAMVMVKRERYGRGWLVGLAAAAGSACGTKYPGGILLWPLLVVAWQARKSGSGGRPLLLVLSVFAATFVVTTPGVLFDFNTFVSNVVFEVRHYARGHFGYSVSPGPVHVGLILQYLSMVAFSKYTPVALVFFAFAIAGGVFVWRQERRLAFLLLWLPLVYVLYMGMQRVMFVRNLLFVMPFIAVLSARGAAWVLGFIRQRALRVAAACGIAATIAVNVVWLFHAANTIRNRDTLPYAAKILSYMNSHTDSPTFLSTRAARLAGVGSAAEFPGNATADRTLAEQYLISTCDAFDRKEWPGNRPGRYDVVCGALDVNLDYYPTWGGSCRIVAVGRGTGKLLGAIQGQSRGPGS